LGSNDRFTYAFSTVPQEIISGRDVKTPDRVVEHPVTGQRIQVPGLQPTPGSVYLTLITSMFMHGGIAHIFGNMLFLWIFGDNLEHTMGHLRYAIFYLVCGLAAAFLHIFTNTASIVPTVGASGAIAGVLGAYLVLFPGARVLTLVPIFFFFQLIELPALVFLGFWFVMQFFSGAMSLAAGEQQMGGTAWWAHIGGFVTGISLVWKRRGLRPRRVYDY